MVKQRKSSIELLRIIAMFMIIGYHFCLHPTLWNDITDPTIIHLINFFGSFGKIGVCIFFIISGYFMASSKDLSPRKILPIAQKTWFYSLAIFFVLLISNPSFIINYSSAQDIIGSFFPILTNGYWFVSSLIVVRLLYPYMRNWFDSTNDNSILKLFLILTAVIILPNFLTLPIGGYTTSIFAISEAFYYSFMGYLIHRFKNKINLRVALFSLAVSLTGVIILSALQSGPKDILLLVSPNFPLCILLSASIFIIFTRFDFTSRIINYISGLVFGIYLIHDNNLIRKLLWFGDDSIVKYLDQTSPLLFTLQTILLFVIIFLVCAFIEATRQLVVKIIVGCISKSNLKK